MIRRILNFFRRNPTNTDGLIGEWGVWTPEDNIAKVQGEMYSYKGRWIAGPKLYEDKDKEHLDILNTPRK